MATHTKPLGVVLIAFYYILSGLIYIPLGTLLCYSLFLQDTRPGVPLLGFLLMLLGVSYMASSYGLWTAQPWGRNFAWWLTIASMLLGVAAIFPIFPGQVVFEMKNTILQLAGIAICIIILWYLRRPQIINFYKTGDAPGT